MYCVCASSRGSQAQGKLAIIRDCVVVDDGAVVPANAVVPPYTHVHIDGRTTELADSAGIVLETRARERYAAFRAD